MERIFLKKPKIIDQRTEPCSPPLLSLPISYIKIKRSEALVKPLNEVSRIATAHGAEELYNSLILYIISCYHISNRIKSFFMSG